MKPTLQYVGPAVREIHRLDGVIYAELPAHCVNLRPADGFPIAHLHAMIFEDHSQAALYARGNGMEYVRIGPQGNYS